MTREPPKMERTSPPTNLYTCTLELNAGATSPVALVAAFEEIGMMAVKILKDHGLSQVSVMGQGAREVLSDITVPVES